MRLSIADTAGPVAAGRAVARELRGRAEAAAKDDVVVFDFTGVRVVAPSFADELVAKLPGDLLDAGVIGFVGTNPTIDQLFGMVRRRRVAA
jgi:hypothetical protein